MNHIVELVNIELCIKRLCPFYLDFEAPVVQPILILMQNSLFLVELVGSFGVDVELEFVPHPAH